MPTFNSERFIQGSIEALLAQDYPNIELIISDDGSRDGTAEIARSYAEGDPRVSFHPGPRLGERANFNTVLSLARGEYFMWAADHDLWSVAFVSACVEALERDPAAVLAYTHSVLIDARGEYLGPQDDELDIHQPSAIDRYVAVLDRLSNCNAIYGLMRREPLATTGGYGDNAAPDHLVLAQMALKGTFVQLPQVMFFRRQNRPPDATWEEHIVRTARDLNPASADARLAAPRADYYVSLRHGHLDAVLHAPLGPMAKGRGVLATLAKYEEFGVESRLWRLIRRVSRLIPASLRPSANRRLRGHD
jgi:hypothetical protein